MFLKTKNYILRPLISDDATERYLGWLHDPDVNRTLDVDGNSQTIASIRSYIESHNNIDDILFGIFTNDDLHIGTHSFRSYPKHKLASITVMIGDKSYWGNRVPLETRAKLLDWAFNDKGFNKISAGCYSINYPAIYNFHKQNWVVEGILKSDRIKKDLILKGKKRFNFFTWEKSSGESITAYKSLL